MTRKKTTQQEREKIVKYCREHNLITKKQLRNTAAAMPKSTIGARNMSTKEMKDLKTIVAANVHKVNYLNLKRHSFK